MEDQYRLFALMLARFLTLGRNYCCRANRADNDQSRYFSIDSRQLCWASHAQWSRLEGCSCSWKSADHYDQPGSTATVLNIIPFFEFIVLQRGSGRAISSLANDRVYRNGELCVACDMAHRYLGPLANASACCRHDS